MDQFLNCKFEVIFLSFLMRTKNFLRKKFKFTAIYELSGNCSISVVAGIIVTIAVLIVQPV